MDLVADRRTRYRIEDRYQAEQGHVVLTGVQALARLPIEQLRADRRQGRHTAALISGYQGSPLGGFGTAARRAAGLVPELPIVCRPAVNEEYAATAIMGSQLAINQPDARYDGVVGLWYGKAPGVDRAVDALRHGVYAGTARWGGAVALVGDDPSAKSSTLPSSSAAIITDLHMPLLYPGDAAEALDLGRHAIALSRFTGLWSAIKIVADVADGMTTVDLDPDRVVPVAPPGFDEATRRRPDGRLLTPATIDLEREIYDVRYPLAIGYAAANGLNATVVNPTKAWLGIIASGITYGEVREALKRLGLGEDRQLADLGIRVLRMHMPIPFSPDTVTQFAQGLEQIFVIEEKQPSIETRIKSTLYAMANRPQVFGKHDLAGAPLLRTFGHLDADELMAPLRRILAPRLGDHLIPEQPTRTRIPVPIASARAPFYCSGCPHNRSTRAPEGSLVGAGIGCHTMALLMDPDRMGDIAGLTCMGSEGTQWVGMADFVERDHFIQNIGDGTFFHSGQLAVQAAVAAGVNITYKLLYNGTVAMTGGQDPEGLLPVPALARSLLAQGVAEVLVTTDDPGKYRRSRRPGRPGGQDHEALPAGVKVWDRSRLLEAQEHLAGVPGTTVLIHDQRCAAELRRDRKRGRVPTPTQRVVINHRICEGCGDCGQVSNCLSVQPFETDFGRKTRIDQTTCNLDFSCLEGDCPAFMTVVPAPAASSPSSSPPLPPAAPPPSVVVDTDQFTMRVTGIGGTGIVTLAQIIGTAGMLDGFAVTGLDQIGLSQKAGPVVSDVRLSRRTTDSTNRLGRRQADLLLVCDQLVAVTERGLNVCAPGHTIVVGSTSATPTGEMITRPDLAMTDPDVLAAAIAAETNPHAQFWADAQAITTALFGDAVPANMFVVGMAVQAGALPISVDALEQAIELNGVAVATNLAALAWGRAQVADPAAVATHLGGRVSAAPVRLSSEVRHRVEALGQRSGLTAELDRFARDLVGWQNEATAVAYLDTIAAVIEVDAPLDRGFALSRAAATYLHRLTAYKDEYEVARLMLDDDAMAEARRVAGRRGRIRHRLHPPMLRSLGMDSKLAISTRAAPAFAVLAKAKRLRGTRLDPFGRPEVRRLERSLAPEYRAVLTTLLASLGPHNYDDAVMIASLPETVRGYEDLKIRRIAEYRERLEAAVADYTMGNNVPAGDEKGTSP